jgi:hypothetical protein
MKKSFEGKLEGVEKGAFILYYHSNYKINGEIERLVFGTFDNVEGDVMTLNNRCKLYSERRELKKRTRRMEKTGTHTLAYGSVEVYVDDDILEYLKSAEGFRQYYSEVERLMRFCSE